jgi:hypothetical protein
MGVYKLSEAGTLVQPRTSYKSMLAGNAAFAEPIENDYELIATAFGTGTSAAIVFSSIPQDYKHLQIRYTARGSSSSVTRMDLRLNNITTANTYSTHYLEGTGAAVTSVFDGNAASIILAKGMARTSRPYTNYILDILDYTSTSKNTTIKALGGLVDSITLTSGVLLSTAAITAVSITPSGGVSLNVNSRFSLYGLKG